MKMNTESVIDARWAELLRSASEAAKRLLQELSDRHACEFATAFYEEMRRDPDASGFFSNELTTTRLHETMRRWIEDLFESHDATKVSALIASQRRMGQVHARIGVRIELVMRGTRLLKQAIIDALLREATDPDHLQAAKISIEIIDMAIEIVADQYSKSHEVEARKDEAYRNYAASLNMSVERERQRAALLSWENQLLQAVVVGPSAESLPLISKSPFGLWLRHKAAALFPENGELRDVLHAIERIDDRLDFFSAGKAAQNDSEAARKLLGHVLQDAKQVAALVETLFECLVTLETGRDPLTQLLSRRFQSTILTREIDLSRNAGKPFAVMLIDVDHFKQVNDHFGHEAGDRVLRHVAGVFAENVRGGDFIFRHGGEEFMIVCVELAAQEAMRVADKIRAAVEAEAISISETTRLSITVSVGVAAYGGHPDYQRLVARADKALYEAKRGGRNRCSLAA
jgi:diguanylate cyclase